MFRARSFFLVLALASVVGCHEHAPAPATSRPGSVGGPEGEAIVVRRLLAAANSGNQSLRFDFHGECDSEHTDVISLPAVTLGVTKEEDSALAKVQELIGGNQQVSIRGQDNGIIRVKLGDVSSGVLQTGVGHITLDKYSSRDPWKAVDTINGLNEVNLSLAHLNTRHVYYCCGTLGGHPMPRVAQLGPEVDGVTVDTYLDQILSSFPGLIVYKECTRPSGLHLFDVQYYIDPSRDGNQIARPSGVGQEK
jgi:hypothetical protein